MSEPTTFSNRSNNGVDGVPTPMSLQSFFAGRQETFAMTPFARASLIATVVHAVARAWNVFQNRRETMKLFALSDSQLADIGLSRADVHRALQLPFFADPSPTLNDWARQNRVIWRPEIDARQRTNLIREIAAAQTPKPSSKLAA